MFTKRSSSKTTRRDKPQRQQMAQPSDKAQASGASQDRPRPRRPAPQNSKKREHIEQLIAEDARFQVLTFDRMHWIDPFHGKIHDAPFEWQDTARAFLSELPSPWPKRILVPKQLSIAAWLHFLKEHIREDDRLTIFRDGLWLDPCSGQLVKGIPLDDHHQISSATLRAMARHLAMAGTSPNHVRPRSELHHHVDRQHEVHTDGLLEMDDNDLVLSEADRSAMHISEPSTGQFRKSSQSESSNGVCERTRSVQDHMLPEIPEWPGLEIAVRFLPYDDVSGDFYEFIDLPDGRGLCVIGDVSGHGTQAGLVVHATLKALRFICRSEHDLRRIVQQLNDELIEDTLSDQFITAAFIAIDFNDQRIEHLLAGHHGFLIARPDTGHFCEQLGHRGPALGILPTATFSKALKSHVYQLQPGEYCFQCTDGIIEAMDRYKNEYGMHRLAGCFTQTVVENPDCGATALVEAIEQDVNTFTRKRFDDDLTFFALRTDR